MWGGGVACLSSDSCACLEVGPQGACAVHEGEDIHVFVASVVCAVYKAGLGGGADFVEKGSGCQCGGVGGILVFNGLGQYGSGFGLQLFYGVGAASGAFFGGAAADEAEARGKSQFGAVDFVACGCEYVYVEKSSKGRIVFDGAGDFFQEQRVCVNLVDGFVSGRGVFFQAVEAGDVQGVQLLCYCRFYQLKYILYNGAGFYGACDVHGKGDNGSFIFCQKFLLGLGAALSGIQHFCEGYLVVHRVNFSFRYWRQQYIRTAWRDIYMVWRISSFLYSAIFSAVCSQVMPETT